MQGTSVQQRPSGVARRLQPDSWCVTVCTSMTEFVSVYTELTKFMNCTQFFSPLTPGHDLMCMGGVCMQNQT